MILFLFAEKALTHLKREYRYLYPISIQASNTSTCFMSLD
jgi:hypothetical protein